MFHPTGLTTLLTLGLLAERVVAAPAPAPRSDASVSWGSCESFGLNSTDPNLQCGYLEVPMDYHDSSAGTARLAVAKYAATVTNKLGTIFFNPGGPGGSGVGVVASLGPEVSQASKGAYDFISWDPRGVGHTFPGEVTCFDSVEEDAGFWNNTVVQYINETISGKFDNQDLQELYSQANPTEQKFKDFTNHCQNGPAGPYLKYFGTSSTVRDLVSLGNAIVGSDKPIDFWGISYGTVIGFNFVNMFPERAGHVILDGVVDPTIWISYKFLHSALVDTEKTYSGLTDGCAAAGKAGCKLIELTGDNASGDDVKTLLDNTHDLALQLYRDGIEIPFPPGHLKAHVFDLLYTPATWSESVNTEVYPVVAVILQIAQAHNVTVGGGVKYNVPSAIDSPSASSEASSQNLTSYSSVAIAGGDDFNDGSVTIKDVFGIIVNTTREVTPTFGTVWSLGYSSYGWPVRSVEKLPSPSPSQLKQLKIPVLVIGNSADPITPFVNAQNTANILGDNAFLVEQMGFGHTSLAQDSACTLGIMLNYVANSKLPEGRSTQCPVDNTNLFPVLNGTTTSAKRSNFLRRWL